MSLLSGRLTNRMPIHKPKKYFLILAVILIVILSFLFSHLKKINFLYAYLISINLITLLFYGFDKYNVHCSDNPVIIKMKCRSRICEERWLASGTLYALLDGTKGKAR
jgi:hypothetical protein